MKSKTTSKFETKNESFDKDYVKNAHHQQNFNEKIIEDLSSSIVQWFPRSKNLPIKILDLCCGHGKPTYDLLESLKMKEVSVEKIVGYDISEDQINNAKASYSDVPELDFYVQNVENISDKNEFDIVISLFGLHWMEDIKKSAELISEALKPGGHLMFFVPLEKMDLFQFRIDYMLQPEWKTFFENYNLQPFISDQDEYISAFNQHFQCDSDFTVKGTRELEYSKEQFVAFLSSWMQELRHLKKQPDCHNPNDYVRGLVENIPIESDTLINVRKLITKDTIIFTEHFFSYQGTVDLIESAEVNTTEVLGITTNKEHYFDAVA